MRLSVNLTRSLVASFVLAVTLCPAVTTWAGFAVVLTDEHADVGVAYEDDELHMEVHDETNNPPDGIEYEPAGALLFVGPSARIVQPNQPSFSFTGALPGAMLWVLPASPEPNLLFLGGAAEEVPFDAFPTYLEADPRISSTGEWVRFSLKAVRGPGKFSVWSSEFGDPLVWMSSFDGGIDSSDSFFVLAGGHTDFNWGFTAAGLYEVDLEASAFRGPNQTDLISSGIVTYHFGVETVPEPASVVLLAGGMCSIYFLRRIRGCWQSRAA